MREAKKEMLASRAIQDWMGSLSGGPLDRTDWLDLLAPLEQWVGTAKTQDMR